MNWRSELLQRLQEVRSNYKTCNQLNGNQAVLGAATYHDQYVRENGVWKFHHVRIESHFWTPFEEGWARLQFIQRR